MPISLIKRIPLGAPLSAVQHDQNLSDIEDGVNTLEDLLSVSLDADGKLKPGALDDVSAIADALITLAKLASTTANAYLTTSPTGVIQPLGGGDSSKVMGFDASGYPAVVDATPAPADGHQMTLFNGVLPGLVAISSTVTSWTEYDLTSLIEGEGITPPVVAAILWAEISYGQGTSAASRTLRLNLTGDNSIATSTTAAAALVVSSGNPGDAARTSQAGASGMFFVPLDVDNKFYYNLISTGTPPSPYAQIRLAGFVHLP